MRPGAAGLNPKITNPEIILSSNIGAGSKYPGRRRCSFTTSSFNSRPRPGVSGTAT